MVEIIKAHYHTRISELSYYKKESSLASLTNHFPNIAELRIHFFGKHLSINVFHGSTIWKIYFPPQPDLLNIIKFCIQRDVGLLLQNMSLSY